jgi:hypothetical protein
VLPELGSKAPYVDIHGPGATEVVITPDFAEELLSGKDPSRIFIQVPE